MGLSARYDLSRQPSTYDFFTWLVHVKALGATEIVIDTSNIRTSKWSVAETRRRLENYLMPGPALARLPVRIASDGQCCGSHMVQDLPQFERLVSVLPPATAEYTVTLRETFHNPQKNSDRAVWLKFADRIGAVVIEDHMVQPIRLYDRMALYAGARINFGVVNGPMTLCSMTPYPVTIFCDPETTARGFKDHGIDVGGQYPYALSSQRLIWEKPTVEGLMRAFNG